MLTNINRLPHSFFECLNRFVPEEMDQMNHTTRNASKRALFAAEVKAPQAIAADAPTYLDWHARPLDLQTRIDNVFRSLSKKITSDWYYNGEPHYDLAGVREYELMKRLILKAPSSQLDFYALDIGAGDFTWGDGLAKFLNDQPDLPQGIRVHIVGVRGEGYLGDREVQTDRCAIYKLGAFKIENIFEEFQKAQIPLRNPIDLVVSRWCLRHLSDPVGTFSQIYNLLRPKTGFFLFDGFFWLMQDQSLVKNNHNRNMSQLLVDTQAIFLTTFYNNSRSLNHFILKRPNIKPCHLPLSYQGFIEAEESWQINSKTVTRFNRESREANVETSKGNFDYYQGDKEIYDWLTDNDLWVDPDNEWGPLVHQ